jgi:hypothetical protein
MQISAMCLLPGILYEHAAAPVGDDVAVRDAPLPAMDDGGIRT